MARENGTKEAKRGSFYGLRSVLSSAAAECANLAFHGTGLYLPLYPHVVQFSFAFHASPADHKRRPAELVGIRTRRIRAVCKIYPRNGQDFPYPLGASWSLQILEILPSESCGTVGYEYREILADVQSAVASSADILRIECSGRDKGIPHR
ncbi:hypothetical protein KM043_015348 [Ampulex compressa]|nr:hypothetical protein KM043_015348 [Ampulex compressa]